MLGRIRTICNWLAIGVLGFILINPEGLLANNLSCRALLSNHNLSTENSAAAIIDAAEGLANQSESPIDAISKHIKTALLKEFDLSEEEAQEFGRRAQKHLTQAYGQRWSDYVAEQKKSGTQIVLSKEHFKAAVDKILGKVRVFEQYTIPYLAGYSKTSAKIVFIDKNFPKLSKVKMQDGSYQKINLRPFIVLHEAIEKALLKSVPYTERRYLRTHQIAQRIEKDFVESHGISWQDYQHRVLKNEIARANRQKVELVPKDLDYTPYEEFKDAEDLALIHKMKSAAETSSLRSARIEEPIPGVILLKFFDKREMARTLIRFQEFYESPQFQNQIFTRKEFADWYRKQNGRFNYYAKWDGFNFPGSTLTPFAAGEFPHINQEEQKIISTLKEKSQSNFSRIYVIAVAENSESTVYNHELAHALYYLNPDYRAAVNKILDEVDVTKVEQFLKEKMSDYSDSVLRDEAHAWLMHDSESLVEMGFDLGPYKSAIEKLNAIFLKCMAP